MAIMYALGLFVFASETIIPNAVDRQTPYNWQSLQRNGRTPARQPIGKGDETLSLRGYFFPCESDKTWTLETLRLQADQMEPMILISMSGLVDGWSYVQGRWTVDNISEGRTLLWPNGKPRKVEFDLSLTRYGEDMDNANNLLRF
jgi:hypothetical protein